MQHKLKVLFDMEQLAVSGTNGTGVVRVADILFKKLCRSKNIEVYPLLTSFRGDVAFYLDTVGLSDQKSKLVYMTSLRKTCKHDNLYKTIVAKIFEAICRIKYGRRLQNFDAYISVFSPVSPVIYKSKLKTFAFVHDLIPVLFPEYCNAKFAKKYTQWMKSVKSDIVFAISNSTRNDFCAFRPDYDAGKVKVVYLGADERFKPVKNAEIRAKYNIKTAKYILAVSEISARKNFEHLLKSFAVLNAAYQVKDVSLVLVGPKRKGFNAVDDLLRDMPSCLNNIVQTGYADDADMPALYSEACAFVYPSLYEGFGLPVLEAMQCGTPVICANNSSLPEVGGSAALYVSGHDEHETASVLHKLCTDKNLCDTPSAKAIKQAKKFAWGTFAKQIEQCVITECANR